jgi:hypothetical protein
MRKNGPTIIVFLLFLIYRTSLGESKRFLLFFLNLSRTLSQEKIDFLFFLSVIERKKLDKEMCFLFRRLTRIGVDILV